MSLYKKNPINIYILLTLIFLLNPTLAVAIFLIVVLKSNKREYAVPFIILVLAYIFTVQLTRKWGYAANDWEMSSYEFGYYAKYVESSRQNLVSFFLDKPSEGVYQVLFWLGSRIFGSNYRGFMYILSIATYGFMLNAIYLFWKYNNLGLRCLVCMVSIFAFTSSQLGVINNIVRQELAFSIMLNGIIIKLLRDRWSWIMIIAPVFLHSMTILFLPFAFLTKVFNQRLSVRVLIVILFLLAVARYAFSHLAVFSSFDLLTFQKFASSADYELDDVINPSVIFVFFGMTFIFYLSNVLLSHKLSPSGIYMHTLLLMLMTLVSMMVEMPLVMTRFYILRLFLMCFVFPFAFMRWKSINEIYQSLVALVFLFSFISIDTDLFNIYEHVLFKSFPEIIFN